MSLQGGRDALFKSLEKLHAHWARAEPYWQDSMKTQFVEQTLAPLEEHVKAAMGAIDLMETILREMRRDCEGSQFDIYGSAHDDGR